MTAKPTTTDPPDAATLLVKVTRAQGQLEAAQDALQAAVLSALAAGASYGQIGAALGISRQAAWERFAPMVEGSTR